MARNRRVAAGEYALLFESEAVSGASRAGKRGTVQVVGALAAAAALLWFMFTAPLRAEVRELRRDLPAFRSEHAQMRGLYETYQQLQGDDHTLEGWIRARPPDFALFAHVTEIAQGQALALASLRPSARPVTDRWQLERVKVELEDVSLAALVGFLHALTAPATVVQVEVFELRGGTAGLNVSFEAQTLTLRP